MTRIRLSNAHLVGLAVALGAAFVLLPRPLAQALSGHSYGDEQHLSDKVAAAFVTYWHAGRRSLTPELAHLVDYWRWYHVAKTVTAIGVLIVLVVLAIRLFKTYARTDQQAGAWSSATGGVVAALLSAVAFVAALANIQGTIAPFSSLMSMLPINSAHGSLKAMIGQVKHDVAHYSGDSPGPLRMMVHDLAVYHVVVSVIAGLFALVLVVLMIMSWRTYARTPTIDRRGRRLFRGLGIAALVVAALLAILAAGNQSAVIDSPTAVLNFYKGTY
jgi:heme A synthase